MASPTLSGVTLTQRFWLTLCAVLVAMTPVLAMLATRASEPPPIIGVASGAPGLGDPYLPTAGGGGYDVQHYEIQVQAEPLGSTLTGTTTITAVALEDLDSVNLDLLLTASAARVDGKPAGLEQQGDQVRVTATRSDPARPAIAAGATFTMTLDYAGEPDRVSAGAVPSFYRAGNEFVIAGEPAGATLWYPASDHPRDPATMQFTISVPRGTEAICAGRLLTRGADPTHAERDRWVWQVDAPTVSYATFLAVGQYRLDQGVADGRPFVNAVSERLTPSEQSDALRWLHRTPAAIRKLEKYLGPYPFSGSGGFVSSVELYWGGLETAMRPVYNKQGVGSETLLNHELAHMWLGDTVTLHEWNDIFDNESLTTYAEWLTTTGSDPQQAFNEGYRGSARDDPFWAPPLSDPGVEHMFERVYDRGPLAVHALRTRLGDDAFFGLLKAWAQQSGPHSLEQFRAMADDATPDSLTGFFTEWLDQTDRPAATAENGVTRR